MPLPKTPPDHGTRSCYVRWKCRCKLCKKANREYAAERAKLMKELAATLPQPTKPGLRTWGSKLGKKYVRHQKRMCQGVTGIGCPSKSYLRKDSTGDLCEACREGLIRRFTLVPTTKVRRHIAKLRKHGMGLRSIAFVAEVSRTSLVEIVTGRRTGISPETQNAILEVRAGVTTSPVQTICPDCGRRHIRGERLTWLLTKLPADADSLTEAWPCVYEAKEHNTRKTSAGQRMLFRDLTDIGAERITSGIWVLPQKTPQEVSG